MSRLRNIILEMKSLNNEINDYAKAEIEKYKKTIENEEYKLKLIAKKELELEYEKESLKLNILGNRLKLDIYFDVEVKLSTISNELGVFSTDFIQKNELITLFPIDSYEKNNKMFFSKIDKHFNNHRYFINNSVIVSGDPNNYSSEYCGHMCNDRVVYNDIKGKNIYENISKLKSNAQIVLIENLCLAVISTCDINEGDEIFLHYGTDLWNLLKN